MEIRIPEEDYDMVALISRLSPEATDEIVTLLRGQPVQLYAKESMAAAVAKEAKLTPHDDIFGIVDVLFSMYQSMCVGLNSRPEEFAASVIEEVSDIVDTDAFENLDLGSLESNLTKLLNVDSLGISAKALFLHLENDRNLITSKVVTDLRPVFEPTGDSVSAMVLVHSLKLNYFDSNGTRSEFSIALDSKDIETLILNLERARIKTNSLRSFTNAASIPLLENDIK